jgi:hypothetical protein
LGLLSVFTLNLQREHGDIVAAGAEQVLADRGGAQDLRPRGIPAAIDAFTSKSHRSHFQIKARSRW